MTRPNVVSIQTRKPIDPTPTAQADLFRETQPPVYSCPLGCGKEGLHSKQQVRGHLSHCRERKRAAAQQGTAKMRAWLERNT